MAGPLPTNSDSLLARVARGDQAAFQACVERFGGMIWSLARRFSYRTADAEDGAQDVFLQLWKSAKLYDASRGSEPVFVATLARRVLIDRFRAQRRQPREVSVEELSGNDWEPGALAHEGDHVEARLAAQELAELPAEQQRVIRLSVLEGLSQGDIATRTGLPLGTVKTLMRRGFLKIRERLAGGRP
ncbi:MAG: sigma-70 family RNA polymerase sigma factor [Vicinamibacterales bacterium]